LERRGAKCTLVPLALLILEPPLFAFSSSFFFALDRFGGTVSAEDKDGKHDEVKRAPAAITSLSAASRCASRPPSDPSDKSPRTWNPVRNDRVLPHLGLP
jgi:hypothetical protein